MLHIGFLKDLTLDPADSGAEVFDEVRCLNHRRLLKCQGCRNCIAEDDARRQGKLQVIIRLLL